MEDTLIPPPAPRRGCCAGRGDISVTQSYSFDVSDSELATRRSIILYDRDPHGVAIQSQFTMLAGADIADLTIRVLHNEV